MTIEEFKKNIAPYMRHAWMFMDDCGIWWCCRFDKKPKFNGDDWYVDSFRYPLEMFDIEPVDDWTQFLTEVGNDK